MRWQLFIHDIIISAVMTLFMCRLYTPKLHKKYIYFVAFIATIITVTGIDLLQNGIIQCILFVLCANLITLCLFQVRLPSCAVKNTVFILLVILGDLASKSLILTVTDATLFGFVGIRITTALTSMLEWIILIFCFKTVIYFFSKEKRNKIKTTEITFLMLLTIGELLLSSYMLSITSNNDVGLIVVMMLFGFIVLNLYITWLLQAVEATEILEKQLQLASQQSQIQLKCYQEMMMEQELAQKIIHDVRRHLQMLEALYGFQSNDNGSKYALLLEEELDKLAFSFPCSNMILGVIINAKLADGRINSISFEPRIEDISLAFLSDLDITALFSNLLDNAFEACMILPKEERTVKLSLLKAQEFLVLNVQNPFHIISKKDDDTFRTTKEGHIGVGLSNIRHVVEKYEGVCKIEAENQNFIVSVSIPIP